MRQARGRLHAGYRRQGVREQRLLEPVSALTTLSTMLHERYAGSGAPRYCTAVFGTPEPGPATGKPSVHLASGGHPPVIVLRADGTADFLPTPGGLLAGILPSARFTAARTVLGPGDTLLLHTDGLTEARTGHRSLRRRGAARLRRRSRGQAAPCRDPGPDRPSGQLR